MTQSRMTFIVDRRAEYGDDVEIKFSLPPGALSNVRAKDIGDELKRLVAEGIWKDGSVNHHHPLTWPKVIYPTAGAKEAK